MSKVLALHLKPASGVLEPVESLQAVAGQGFVGDVCFGRATRQALLVGKETLDEFGFVPGTLREQITVDLSGLQKLASGTRLKVGEAVLEIEKDCEPCGNMARRLGEEPKAFTEKIAFKRGMLAKVIGDGTINTGDEVAILGAE